MSDRIIICTPEECDMVTSNMFVQNILRERLSLNQGNPIWYEPVGHGELPRPVLTGNLPSQDPLNRVVQALSSAGRGHARLATVKCRCGYRHVASSPCRNCGRR